MPALGTTPRVGAPFGAQVGDFPLIPEEYQEAVNYGVRFFELRWPKPLYHEERIFGPFDVRVSGELEAGGNRIRYHANWRTAETAQVRYQVVNNRGLAMAFMPDDKEWHNRVILVDNPGLIVHQYHTKDGIVPGSIIKAELRSLFEELYESVTIYRVVDMGRNREVGFGYTREEAEKVRHQKDIARDQQTNVIREVQPFIECEIVEGQKWVKTQRIRDLIQTYRHLPSWTHCDAFQQEIKPAVEARIAASREQMAAEAPKLTPAEVLQMFRSASAAERAELRRFLVGDALTPTVVEHPIGQTGQAVEGETTVAPPETPEDLSALTVAELRVRLEEMDPEAPVKNMKKADLIAAIRRRSALMTGLAEPTDEPLTSAQPEEAVT